MERVGNLVFFLILKKVLSAFAVEYDVICVLVIRGLYYVEAYSLVAQMV